MNEKRKIGIIGGNFNPPHFAHLMMAECSASQLDLEKVIFIPTGRISYKSDIENASPTDRFNMTRLAIDGNPLFEISDIESVNDEYSYTFSTLEKMHNMYPDSHFYFILGADSLNYIEKWREPKRIFELATIVAIKRKGFDDCKKKEEYLKSNFNADIVFVEMPRLDISSSCIRQRIKHRKTVRYMLPENVLKYINEKKLYL